MLFRPIWAYLTPNYEKNRKASGHPKFTKGVHFGRFSVIFPVSIADPYGKMEAIWGVQSGPNFCLSGEPKLCNMGDSGAFYANTTSVFDSETKFQKSLFWFSYVGCQLWTAW